MKSFVIDASVAVKWFIPEVHSAAAQRLLDEDILLAAPDLILPELGNVLWKKVRLGELTGQDATEILRGFATAPVDLCSSEALIAAALELAPGLECTVYDCLYLALAVARDCRLVTADRKFHGALRSSPFESNIRWVEDEL